MPDHPPHHPSRFSTITDTIRTSARLLLIQTFHPCQKPPLRSLRVMVALMVSLLAHIIIITPWRWPFSAHPAAGQIYLQARLRPIAPNTKTPSENKARHETKQPPGISADKSSGHMIAAARNGSWTTAADTGETSQSAPVTPPEAQVTNQPTPPEYPEEALRRNLESCVLAAIDVAIDGSVSKVEILAADIPGVFDQAVIESQLNATYLPAYRNGTAVPSRVLSVTSFVLTADRHLNCARQYAPMAGQLLKSPLSESK